VNPEELSFAEQLEAYEKGRVPRGATPGGPRRGVVAAVAGDRAFVDIGGKSEGVVLLAELPAPPKPGDELSVTITGRDDEGNLLLSVAKAGRPRDWTGLQRAFDHKEVIAGRVIGAVKGGLSVDVGVRAFLPASRSGCRETADLEKLTGEEIRCRITQIDIDDENVILDRRTVLEDEALAALEEKVRSLQEGAVVRGVVRSLTAFGAFVDLGGIEGLLHASDMAWRRVSDPKVFFAPGQEVEVKILAIERGASGAKPRISLGIKQLSADPWTTIPERLKEGDRVRGSVTKLMDFGAFVEIEPGVEGLIHVSEMSWAKRVRHPGDLVKPGDVVEAVVLGINTKDRRIALGLKQALGDPWADAAGRFAPGTVVDGTVRNLQKFGAFVELTEGVEGLLHVSDLVSDRRLNHPSEVLRQDHKVRAVVLECDPGKKRIKLGMKQLEPDASDEYIQEHKAGDEVMGRVLRIEGGEARVELGEGVIGICRSGQPFQPAPAGAFASQLAAVWKREAPPAETPAGREPLQAGQVRSFRITAIDAASKRIDLN